MDRRDFLKAAGAASLTLLTPQLSFAQTSDFWTRDRVLWLRLAETKQEFRVVFWSQGRVDLDNYVRLCYLLRDFHEDKTVMMDVNLLNLMYGIQYWEDLEYHEPSPLMVQRGYSTPQTNARIENAAQFSEHLNGKAVDVKSLRSNPRSIGNKAEFFKMGGVGYYPTHTHIDTARVRTFHGKPGHYRKA